MREDRMYLSKERINKFLNEREANNLNHVTHAALSDAKLLHEICLGIKSKPETYRYNCYKVILQMSKKHPELLYPHWDYFCELLKSPNAYHRMAAITVIAYLTSIDTEKKFELIFDDFFQLLDDKSMIVARYLAMSGGIIAGNKPVLRESIINKLLNIDAAHHTEERKDLIKHDIIQTIHLLFEMLTEKEKIISFVEKQINCSSPKTRRAAKTFVEKWKR